MLKIFVHSMASVAREVLRGDGRGRIRDLVRRAHGLTRAPTEGRRGNRRTLEEP